MGTSISDIKKLYGRSAGRCNICELLLVESDVHIGEMAHVIAESPKGPRGKDLLADNTYDNLILLCPTHHKTVDKKPHQYPVEELKKIKENFEKSIESRLDTTKDYQLDLSTLNTFFEYIPINSFRAMAAELPFKVKTSFCASDEFFNFCLDNPHKYPFCNNELTILWEEFMEKLNLINDWMSGTITTKDNVLITQEEMINNLSSNRPGYNVYQLCDYNSNYLVLDKRNLTREQIEIVTKKVSVLKQEFIYVHTELINYIRLNYKDIVW